MLRSLERGRLANAMRASGFKDDGYNNWFGTQLLYKLLSDKDHGVIISISNDDSIDTIVERIHMTAFRTRHLTKVSKREIYRLGNRVKRSYEQEAYRDPTGTLNVIK